MKAYQDSSGECYQEVYQQHYIFWINDNGGTKVRPIDCSTSAPLGPWADNLTHYSNPE